MTKKPKTKKGDDEPPLSGLLWWIIIIGLAILTAFLWWLAIRQAESRPRLFEINQEPYLYQTAMPITPVFKTYAVITAYNPVPAQTDSTPDITASGQKVREGIVACPRWLKFGTIVEIDGKLYECQDRMNPRYWYKNHFDILMFDYQQAREFGRKIKEVVIYR